MVVFSQFDIIYFGIYSGRPSRGIGVQRTGEPMPLVQFHSVGFPRRPVTIDLSITRDVSRGTPAYHFAYRLDGVEWRDMGLDWRITKAPLYVGLIAKTWSKVRLIVDFDSIHVSTF